MYSEEVIQKTLFDFLIETSHLKDPVQVASGDWGELLAFNFEQDERRRCFYLSFEALEQSPQALSELMERAKPDDIVLAAFPPSERGGVVKKKRKISSILRAFSANGFHACGRFALNPDPLTPQILFDLQPHILAYVEIVSHRCGDAFFKFAAKKAKVALFGTFSWRGWEVVALRRGGVGNPLPKIADRYLFLTPDREVALVFASEARLPTHVEKKGPLDALTHEWRNHQWAVTCLGATVPSLLEFFPAEGQAVMKMEYIPEKTLTNVVSEALLRQRRLEKETLAALDFLQTVFTRFHQTGQGRRQKLDSAMQAVITEGLAFILPSDNESAARTRLEKALDQNVFPLIPQHGDFCVRNVLYRNARQMVLIDWEDFTLASLPLIDLNMLCISLAETWAQIAGDNGEEFINNTVVQKKIAALSNHMRGQLDAAAGEWHICGLLSLACVVGSNLRKNRLATAMKIREEFLRQLDLFEF